jgi:hypothetical protein
MTCNIGKTLRSKFLTTSSKITFCILIALSPSACKSVNSASQAKVIGGREAASGEFPATVKLYEQSCTGTMIAKNIILTAGHCVYLGGLDYSLRGFMTNGVYGPNDSIELKVGGQRLSSEVKITFVHPSWGDAVRTGKIDPSHGTALMQEIHDMALIVLKEPLPSNGIATISDDPVNIGESITMNGYGCEQLGGRSTEALKVGEVAISKINHNVLIAPYGQDAELCPGDSGGPAYRKGSNSEIVGVNVFRADEEGGFGFSRVDSQLGINAWIREKMKAADQFTPPLGAESKEAYVGEVFKIIRKQYTKCEISAQVSDDGESEGSFWIRWTIKYTADSEAIERQSPASIYDTIPEGVARALDYRGEVLEQCK